MSLEPPGTVPPLDAAADDSLIVDGLERALAQARSTLPDHEGEADAASLNKFLDESDAKVAPTLPPSDLAIDSSAVMTVLRQAIDRYTNGDGHELGTWDDSVAAVPTVALDAPHRHVAAGYERDRRRLAAVVVVLFFLVFGFGFQRFTGGGGKSSTKTVSTIQGQAVTTLGRPSTVTSPVTGEVLPPPTEAGTVATAGQSATTTHKGGPNPTDPPSTDPVDTTPSTDPVTTQPETTTTQPETTTTQPETTTTAPCGDPLPLC